MLEALKKWWEQWQQERLERQCAKWDHVPIRMFSGDIICIHCDRILWKAPASWAHIYLMNRRGE